MFEQKESWASVGGASRLHSLHTRPACLNRAFIAKFLTGHYIDVAVVDSVGVSSDLSF